MNDRALSFLNEKFDWAETPLELQDKLKQQKQVFRRASLLQQAMNTPNSLKALALLKELLMYGPKEEIYECYAKLYQKFW